jgi:hypothetical protein
MKKNSFEHTFLWTEEIYLDLNRVFGKQTKPLRVCLAIFFGIICLLWSYTFLLGATILFFLSLMLFGSSLFPGITRLSFRKLSYLHEPISYGFSKKILWCKNKKINVKASWDIASVLEERQNWIRIAASGTPCFWFPICELKKTNKYFDLIELANIYGVKYQQSKSHKSNQKRSMQIQDPPAIFPQPRDLSLLESQRIVVDLRTSQVSGLIIHDSRDNVIQVFGQPEIVDEERMLYPSRGVAINMIRNRVHAIYLWLSNEGLSEPFPKGADRFVSCNAEVIFENGQPLCITARLKKDEIEDKLHQPGMIDGPDGDGVFGLDYIGKTIEDTYPSLYLSFEFGPSGLRGLWMTH